MKMKRMKFDVKFDASSLKQMNSQFALARASIMYAGKNRNGSFMSKETVEKALPSLYNIPVVAEWSGDKEDFVDHGGKLEETDEGLKYIETTRPFGVVPESSNVEWESIQHPDGQTYEYLMADVLLWYDRYPELEKTIESFSNQSMEIEVLEGKFDKEENLYVIDEFEFSALCLLGQDVEPCFEEAKVSSKYNLDDEFKSSFDKMMEKYNKYIKSKKEEKREEKEVLKDELFLCEKFITQRQKRDALEKVIPNKSEYDEDGNLKEMVDYWIMEIDEGTQGRVIVERYYRSPTKSFNDYGSFNFTYSSESNEAEITSDFTQLIQVYIKPEELEKIEKERDEYKEKLDKVNKALAGISEEFDKLKSFKEKTIEQEHKKEIDEVIDQFKPQLGQLDDFVKIEEIAYEYKKDDLKEELLLLWAKTNYSKAKGKKNNQSSFPSFNNLTDEEDGEEEEFSHDKKLPFNEDYGELNEILLKQIKENKGQ